MELTTETTLPDTQEIFMEQPVPIEEKPPAKPQNVNVPTLVVDAVRELRVDIRTARALERIEANLSWTQVLLILVLITQLGIFIALGVLIAR